jgi:ABC-2 type transport system permease protein
VSAARSLAVGRRVFGQVWSDRRLIVYSLLIPCLLIVLLKLVFSAWPELERLGVDAGQNAIPAGAFVVHFMAFALSASALIRERVAGTLPRTFVSSYRPSELVAGYVLAFSTLAFVQSVLVLSVIAVAYDVENLWGRSPIVIGVIVLLVPASIGLGLLVSAVARTESQIYPFIPAVTLPSILLSGLLIPAEELSWPLRGLGRVVPLTYAEDVLVPVFREGAASSDQVWRLLVLGGFTALLLLLASVTVRETE